ncbi:unnamed protein product [Colias eurytheme]|nr:unnamed protein product [Colias eurytheme]
MLSTNLQKGNHAKLEDFQELARQNKITTQILEAFIQKKLGLASPNYRAPSIFDILPGKKPEDRPIRQSMVDRLKEPSPEGTDNEENQDMNEEVEQDVVEVPEYTDFDALQSVESEQIDSIYSEGKLINKLYNVAY